jgi:uncharacterized lipoprotein YmbA
VNAWLRYCPDLKPAVARIVMGAVLLAASCASPPITLYTLAPASAAGLPSPPSRPTTVIEVRRVSIPDYLDSEDILIRKGNVLIRSTKGRWATRLSLGITRLLTARFAQRRPDALVTDQVQGQAPNERIDVAISEFDVTSAGTGVLDASWQIMPRNLRLPIRRGRRRYTENGPVAGEQDVVTLMTNLLLQLADAVDLPHE